MLHKVAILGFTFKENCPDTRNTKVIDIYKELKGYGITPIVVDPVADAAETKRLYGIEFQSMDDVKDMDAVIITVAHDRFKNLTKNDINCFYRTGNAQKVLFDIKGIYERGDYSIGDIKYWNL